MPQTHLNPLEGRKSCWTCKFLYTFDSYGGVGIMCRKNMNNASINPDIEGCAGWGEIEDDKPIKEEIP